MQEQIRRGEVVVVLGRANLAENESFTLHALGEIFHAIPNAKVLPVLRRGNVRGAVAVGLTPQKNSGDAIDILTKAAAGKIECLILLGADPLADVADSDLVARAFNRTRSVISIDTFINSSNRNADVVLPAAAFAEKTGTTTNLEGRISNVTQQITPRGTCRPDWMIATELGLSLGIDLGVSSLDELHQKMTSNIPEFSSCANNPIINSDGVLMVSEASATISRASVVLVDRNSYSYRLIVSRTMYDNAQSTTTSPSLVGIITKSAIYVNPLDLARIGVVDGTNIRVGIADKSIVLPVNAHSGVYRGTAWLPYNHTNVDIRPLLDITSDVVDVRIEQLH